MKPNHYVILAVAILVFATWQKINTDGALGNFRINNNLMKLPEHIEGKASIIDGDSFRIDKNEVRLLGINAPEHNEDCDVDGEKIKCGKIAKEELQQFVGDSVVSCQPVEFDKYGRILSNCSVKGEDLSEWMLRNGYAKKYVDPATLKPEAIKSEIN